MIDSAINAFTTTSGATPAQISLIVRTILYSLLLLWAAWNVYGQYRLVQTHGMDIFDVPMTLMRVLFLCTLMMILVFVA